MVTKKYLCAAPRPEQWESKAEALLKSLGGNPKKRGKVLRQTLASLNQMHQDTKRTGPGRKSNAEHAIMFYEYVLDSNLQENHTKTNDDDDDAGSEHSATKNDDDDDDSLESMNSEEFLKQHNDTCDVCSLGGELLCCSTCNLVFHLKCVRPTLKDLPPGDWSCAHCVITGVRGHKKHSKVWKTAAAAVRYMGRLRSKYEAGESGESEDEESKDEDYAVEAESNTDKPEKDKEEKKDKSDDEKDEEDEKEESKKGDDDEEKNEGDDVENKNENSDDDKKPRKEKGRSLALYKLADSLSPTMRIETSDLVARGRRPRKQPSLYNPQIGPDSHWQSDEYHLIRAVRDGSSVDDSDFLSDGEKDIKKKKATNDNGSGAEDEEKKEAAGFTWCSFCKDDPSVPICVFCACRVCFGKHDKSKLLLCDKCDDEYHIFCLKPPLASVPPASKKWFCPSCRPSNKPEGKFMSTRRASTSFGSHKSEGSAASHGTRGSAKKAEVKKTPRMTTPEPTKKSPKGSTGRPRGRPPKNKSPIVEATPVQPPRKRGRPPKNASPAPVMETPTPRKRGRPPKNASLSPAASTKKQRGFSVSPKADARKTVRSKTTPIEAASSDKRNSTDDVSPLRKKARIESPPKRRARSDSEASEDDEENPPARTMERQKETTDSVDEGRMSAKKSPSYQSNKLSDREEISSETGSDTKQVKQSRSGRTLKRSAFHDEIEEGEQHLKTVRYAMDLLPGADPDPEDPEMETENLPENNEEISVEEPVLETPTVESPAPVLAPIPAPDPPPRPTPKEVPIAIAVVKEQSKAAVPVVEPAKSEAKEGTPSDKPKPQSETPPPKQQTETVKPVAPATVPQIKASSGEANAQPAVTPPTTPAAAAFTSAPTAASASEEKQTPSVKVPRRKPGARECMQISRRFGVKEIPQKYMDTLLDYCTRGKVEHLIRMRERLDEHSRLLEAQLAGLEAHVKEKGEIDIVVPPLPERQEKNPTGTPGK